MSGPPFVTTSGTTVAPLRAPARIKDATAIAGIPQTPFSKQLEPSETELACSVIIDACADAGVNPSEIDALCSYTMEATEEVEIARNIGCGDITFFSQVGYGGG